MRNFLSLCLANFLLFFGFYAVMTLLPFYMDEVVHASHATTGIALTALTVATVVVRPIGGYIYDLIQRRPLYLGAYLLFVCSVAGYAWCTVSGLIIAMRVMQGISFGTATVGGYAILADILPPQRLGRGIGYYGLANTLAMCFAPALALALREHFSYAHIFFICSAISLLGLLAALTVGVPHRDLHCRSRRPRLDDLFVLRGLWPIASFLLAAIPYGMTTGYMALYAIELGLAAEAGLFFTAMAVGVGASRVVGGHLADRIAPQRLIYVGISLCVATYAVTGLLPMGSRLLPHAWLLGLYLLLALCVGTAFGILHPAFNKLMLSLTTADHRGAASSTYLTGFDLGIGTGFLIGGAVASATDSYSMGYLLGAATAVAGLVSFWMWQRQATHSPQKP